MRRKKNAVITKVRTITLFNNPKYPDPLKPLDLPPNVHNYRYDLIGADIDGGVHVHPDIDMKNLGFRILRREGATIADCIFYRASYEGDESEPHIPSYLYKLPNTWRFDDEYTEEDWAAIEKAEMTIQGPAQLVDEITVT